MRAVRAGWLRGGTSKGLFFQAQDLPPHGPGRDALILAALGSPDPSGLQLNGVGGGISSTSKVAVVSTSTRPGIDVDYLFGQVGIKERHIDWQGSCGNLAAAVGVFALQEGLVSLVTEKPWQMRVWQVNQGYEIVLHGDPEGGNLQAVASVAGREPSIYVELKEPHAGKPLLPSGKVRDHLRLPDGSVTEATLVSAGNPTIFVPASVAGLAGTELPSEMDYSQVLPLVDHLRREAAPLMGMEVTEALRVAFVGEPSRYVATSGELIPSEAVHLLSRISTPGRIHHAHTGTGAIALACGALVEGSLPWSCISSSGRPLNNEPLRIGHPGGVMEVRAHVLNSERGWHALGAGFERTARYLMRGEVFIPAPDRAP